MSDAPTNADQRAFWSEEAGQKWVAEQSRMDALFQPILYHLQTVAQLAPGQHVLDIGCGAGSSTAQTAALIGPNGQITGLDISEPLLNAAKTQHANLPNAQFLCADAAHHPFTPGSFDRLISRFGTMFFEDNALAFANLARALKPDGTLTMACWGDIPENPFFTLPARAAREVLGQRPKTDPDAPGPFAFRDPARVQAILDGAGLNGFHVETRPMTLTHKEGPTDLAQLLCTIGPAEGALRYFEADAQAEAHLRDRIMQDLAPFGGSSGVEIPAQIHFYTARRTS